MKPLSSRHHPLVATCRALARGRSDGDDRLLLDGAHLVAEAIRSGVRVDTAAFSGRMLATEEGARLAGELGAGGADLYQVTDTVMDALSPVKTPSGLVALAARPVASLDEVFAGPSPLVVVALGVQEPGNAGAIVRAAEAFGASGVVFGETSADPFGWKALRGSMGSAFRLPVTARASTGDVIDTARRHRVSVAATLARGGRAPHEVDLRGPTAILMGGEGAGLDDGVTEAADIRLTIPMPGPVESLNVAVAAAVLLYEASGQRRAT